MLSRIVISIAMPPRWYSAGKSYRAIVHPPSAPIQQACKPGCCANKLLRNFKRAQIDSIAAATKCDSSYKVNAIPVALHVVRRVRNPAPTNPSFQRQV